MVAITVEFGGGMETLFGGAKTLKTDVPPPSEGAQVTARDVIVWCRDRLVVDRPELFAKGDTIRPGILVLINDADWELDGDLESVIENGDRITFISTLHGG